ncbi:hypothetical protein BDR06DRAFT_998379 [Suillus hirtellus]|nr:hypothetical protein BDR06DRAFT_998379 [Suillus hirtellus]
MPDEYSSADTPSATHASKTFSKPDLHLSNVPLVASLRRSLLSTNKERNELDDQHDLLQAQHADLKSTCTTHENERRKVERSVAVLQKKHGVAESAEQTWSESCKTAQRDARKARKAKEERECKRA